MYGVICLPGWHINAALIQSSQQIHKLHGEQINIGQIQYFSAIRRPICIWNKWAPGVWSSLSVVSGGGVLCETIVTKINSVSSKNQLLRKIISKLEFDLS